MVIFHKTSEGSSGNTNLLGGEEKKTHSLRAGFEPAHGNRIGFQVQRLNHSAIAATVTFIDG